MEGARSAMRGLARVDAEALERRLRDQVDGEVRFDSGTRGAYSTDGSNYRQVPIGVVVPRTVEAGALAARICCEFGAPLLSRGGGTSLGGQCTNTAVVIDWTKYCRGLVSVDAGAGTCVVEPGVVLDDLNRQLQPHGLQFGPKPSTHGQCAIGGMIGNNSCGATAQRYGKTVDNVRALEVMTYDGERFWAGPTSDEELAGIIRQGGRRGEIHRQLSRIRQQYGEEVRRRYPDIPRRVSGYNLDSLLPEQGFDTAGLLVGSEGTLVTVLHAELELVPLVKAQALVVLGYSDIATAADHVPELLSCGEPLQLEAIDGELARFMREQNMFLESLATLPQGNSWLLVQFGGDTVEEADAQADRLLRGIGKTARDADVAVSDVPERENQMLKAREAGLGATADPPGMPKSWEGWEDSAVAPADLGNYLRDLIALYGEHGYERPSFYGHFGQGCVHIRSPFRLKDRAGIRNFRAFLRAAADLVTSYGGSLSGEHGDGQARGELLVRMFGEEIIRAFGELKAAFDPDNRMNPGKVVAPYRPDENLRLGEDYDPVHPHTFFGYPADDGDFAHAASRCVGVGKCRTSTGGVMCPSYMVTKEEEHSTRGRARLLFEMLRGNDDSPVTGGWRSTEVRDALDLCLACKGCKSDCPVGVDMATYKAEFLAHHYAGRLRPAAHYSLGWLPLLAKLARFAPRLTNAALHTRGVADAGKRLAGIAAEREVPRFAHQTFQQWWRRRHTEEPVPGDPRAVVLWPDTFTNHFHPEVGRAAVALLEDAGFRVAVPAQPVCCGLTWISTGQLDIARRVLRRSLRVLRPWVDSEALVVGTEPSCTAVFRSDAHELFPHHEQVQRLRSRMVTLSEALTEHLPEPDWEPPEVDRRAVVQTHCHQHAVLGFDADEELMRRAGIEPDVLDSGCCGLAGNFGFEQGHHEVSMACGERVLFPAVREAPDDAVVLADGFSCRTQIEQGGTGRRAGHLAEVLAEGLR